MLHDPIARWRGFSGGEFCKPLRRARTLHRKPGEIITAIFQRHARGHARLEPGKVLVNFRGVHHEQPLGLADAVDDQIVDHAAALVQHQRVLPVTGREAVHVVCKEAVQPCRRARALCKKLTHVRNVEDPECAAHCVVFVHDSRILHRHVPAAEADHFSTETDVLGVEWRAFQISGVGHGARRVKDGRDVSTSADFAAPPAFKLGVERQKLNVGARRRGRRIQDEDRSPMKPLRGVLTLNFQRPTSQADINAIRAPATARTAPMRCRAARR